MIPSLLAEKETEHLPEIDLEDYVIREKEAWKVKQNEENPSSPWQKYTGQELVKDGIYLVKYNDSKYMRTARFNNSYPDCKITWKTKVVWFMEIPELPEE